MNLSLSFIRGLLAAINPCGFVLLPTYLMYFLGVSTVDGRSQRAPIGRALAVGATVSAGFLGVFLVIGGVTQFGTRWLLAHSTYATAIIGVLFVVLGIAMLFGYKVPIATPGVRADTTEQTVRSMLLYGVAYGVASLGCTLPLFMATLFQAGERDGYGAGLANVVMYSLGMMMVVVSLTLALASANAGFVRWLKHKMQYVEMVSGAFVLLSGLYLLWYFYWRDLRETSDPITDAVDRMQQRAQTWLNDYWLPVAVVLGTAIAAAVVYAARRERTRPRSAQ